MAVLQFLMTTTVTLRAQLKSGAAEFNRPVWDTRDLLEVWVSLPANAEPHLDWLANNQSEVSAESSRQRTGSPGQ